jgi:hypothetical protein
MKTFTSVVLIAVVAALGCKQAPPPAPKEAPPPKPTASEIAQEFRAAMAPLNDSLINLTPCSPAMRDAVAGAMTAVRSKHQSSDNADNLRGAVNQISSEVDDMVKKAREAKRWGLVLGALGAYDVVQPGNTKYDRLKEQANLQINKPAVEVNGFFTDNADNQIYVFLKVTDPTTGKSEVQKVREGEEFSGFRLVKIVGQQKGVTLEYLRIPGEQYDVMK